MEVGDSTVPLIIGTWPTDIVISTLVFIVKGTLIMSLWQIRTPPLQMHNYIRHQMSGQKVQYRQLGHAPVQAEVLTQDGLYFALEGRPSHPGTPETFVLLSISFLSLWDHQKE